MLKGFKDFLLRGNVVELAVAVVVGAAFTAIVTAFTDHIVNPLVATVGGDNELGFGFRIIASNDATFIDFGAVISAAINFVIIAAVVYFVLIVPVNAAKARFAPDKEPEDAPLSETDLLIQIRDLLETGRYTSATDDEGDKARV
ncbi:MAG: large conductance mechanosensitive channel protein MscL [Rhodococcus sp.]|uniref:large conductance mechanosensitive channel protein MscL n=1 Tax=Rhodococcus TaxID=1827 RepID=UPI00169C38A1|nr:MULTISPECIES: large conductance mechanosensitive channel protein MscL [Rhodococcus]NLV78927.1 large conductance mechanosensitive channel protein MscL [Rhodococcus sp. (in: high G+C Gram-positive bacteria)]